MSRPSDDYSTDMPPAQRARFAAVIPVGPGANEPLRVRTVLGSLFAWEPLVEFCVFVEDRDAPCLLESAGLPPSCRAVTLHNPRKGRGYGHTGGLCAGILTAFAWLHKHVAVDFVLKLDTDALVVGKFGSAIASLLARWPQTGIVGTIGISCNPEMRPTQDPRREPDLLRLQRLLPPALPFDATISDVRIEGLGLIPIELVQAFEQLRPHVDRAVSNGFRTSEYAQGGAYAVSWEMLRRMAALGYLARPENWIWIPVGEDMAMTMYATAVGLTLQDASSAGEPFGIHAGGLAYPPQTLLRQGYSIIHSIRGDPRYSECEIVHFFRRHSPTHTYEYPKD
jgi:hypothetical protein